MSIQIKDELNLIPVKTYRWLNVNHLKIDEVLDKEIKTYHKKYADEGNHENILIGRTNKVFSLNKYTDGFKDEIEYGVSKEIVQMAEGMNNAGIFALLKRGKEVNQPIRVEYEMDDEEDVLIDKNIIIAEEYSKATFVVDYSTRGDEEAFHNGVMKVYAKEGSDVKIIKVQRMNDNSYHFDSNVAIVEKGAKVSFIQVEFGCKRAVTNYISNLKDESQSDVYAIYLGDKDRELDLSYYMNHIGRRSISNMEVKGVLKDRAKKIFKGTIDFKLGSSKSTGREEEAVILFDKSVKSDAVPLLLCTEDDVNGQHAASAGRVDDDKLFYMMSRGFSREEAMKLIVEASFNPIIDKIPFEGVRGIIREEIHNRLVMEVKR
ncbi:MAG: Fe-S cluster assembly protein SufD [Tissierellia bacterium]|nr:Fe-S cluster assembly protein SufD [Tissierellia bacterium]